MPDFLTRVSRFLGFRSPVVALLTDFGTRDHYVAAVKGVLLARHRRLQIIDISHDVAPQQTGEAAYLLWAAYRSFPAGTIFLVVVDPGVGTGRPIMVIRAAERTFVAPGNGVLDMVLSDGMPAECFQADEAILRSLSPGPVSTTFHGRDLFAPLAAALSRGVAPERLGTRVAPPVVADPFVRGGNRPVTARILHIDRFGTAVTNFTMESAAARPAWVRIGKRTVRRWAATYADAPAGTPVLMTGSSGLLEIAVPHGSAASTLHLSVGMSVTVSGI